MKWLDEIKQHPKRLLLFLLLSVLSLAGCLFYEHMLSKEYTGEIGLSVKVITESQPVALSAGDYQIAFQYTAGSDHAFSIVTRDGDILYETVLPAGQDLSHQAAFTVPEEDCRITLDASVQEDPVDCSKITLFSEKEIYHDSAVKAGLLFLCCMALLLFAFTSHFRAASGMQKGLWGLLALSVIVRTLPFWMNHYKCGYDGFFHCSRIAGIADALVDGQFPATIYPYCYNGFGVLGRMYPQLFLYPVSLLRFLPVSVLGCYQILFILTGIFSAAIMYYSVRSVTKSELSATLASLFYSVSIYHLQDVFYRNALGEVIAMGFMPLLIAGIMHILKKDRKRGILEFVIACTGIAQSHVIGVILAALLIFVLLLLHVRKVFTQKIWCDLLIAGALTVAVNMGLLLPLVTYMRAGLNTEILKPEVFGFGGTVLTIFGFDYNHVPPLGISGLAFFLIMAVALFAGYKSDKNDEQSAGWTGKFLIVSLLFAILSLRHLPWAKIAQMGAVGTAATYIQFPYRFLTISTVTLAFGAGIALPDLAGRIKNHVYETITYVLVSIFVILAGFHSSLNWMPVKGHADRLYGGLDLMLVQEYLPRETGPGCAVHDDLFTSNPNISVTLYEKEGTHIVCQFFVSEEYNHIDFPLFYYPGYEASYYVPSHMEGISLPVERGDEGRIRVVLPNTPEVAALDIQYKGMWYYKIGYAVSVLTGAVLILWMIPFRKKLKQ
ncbi:MAG: hypothetical protein J5518_00205 [Lachnospiraceae bacterium]|nr:hypothetical protein [Lachnospiraceae bacterium]